MTDDINPAIGAMLKSARDWLTHEHSLFKSLDLEPVMLGRGRATFSVDLPKEFATADGLIHGSLMTIIMDSIFGLAVFTMLDEMKPIATINLRADYIAEAKIDARVICDARCFKTHNDVAFVSGDVRTKEGSTLLSTGSGAFMIGTRGRSKGSRL